MSEKREKKRRYNEKMAFIKAFEAWLDKEPPMIRILKWRKWKKEKPVYEWE